MKWIPSHLGHGIDDRPMDVSHFDVLAHGRADHDARAAADLAQLPDGVPTYHVCHIWQITQIQKRSAVILLSMPSRQVRKAVKEPPNPRKKPEDLLKGTSHCINIKNKIASRHVFKSC